MIKLRLKINCIQTRLGFNILKNDFVFYVLRLLFNYFLASIKTKPCLKVKFFRFKISQVSKL
jgi:hypothetical protein